MQDSGETISIRPCTVAAEVGAVVGAERYFAAGDLRAGAGAVWK